MATIFYVFVMIVMLSNSSLSQDYQASSLEGFIVKHYSGLCLSLENGTDVLVLSKSCDQRFRKTKYNTIMHVSTKKCLIPENEENNAKLIAKTDCKNLFGAFVFTGNSSLQHIKSGKCLHPYWGCPAPSQGEMVVLHEICDQERLKFQFLRENPECKPIYPYCERKAEFTTASSKYHRVVVIQGLDWHWVYIIVIVSGSIIIGQFVFLVCMFRNANRRRKTAKDESLSFGRAAKGNRLSLPYNESSQVQMIGIRSTDYSYEIDEFSDTSSFVDEKESSPPNEVAEEEPPIKSPYINIDFNQNKNGCRIAKKSTSAKECKSKRLSKLSIDVSKMRHLFKIRKSYTLNDLEMLKRKSIENHKYEEPVSPCSSSQSHDDDVERNGYFIKAIETSGYIEPTAKSTRNRSASVPSKFTNHQQQQGYLKPVISDRDKKKCCKGTYISYMNIKPSSPIREERNLYDMPEISPMDEEKGNISLCMETDHYVKILED